MASIGRNRGSNRVYLPNNRGMAGRADAQLNAVAESHAAKYTTALQVDGTPIYLWNKHAGAIPCSCSAAPQGGSINPDIIDPRTQDDFEPEDFFDTSHGSVGDVEEGRTSRYRPLDDGVDPFPFEPAQQSVPDKLNLSNNTPTNYAPEEFDDLDNALQRTDPANAALTDFEDPFQIFSGKLIECPVCLGTGYIDSWQLYNGARVIFDTSGVHNFNQRGVDVDDGTNPTQLHLREAGSTCTWTYRLPYTWLELLRVTLYNRDQPIDPSAYSWTWASGAATGTMSRSGLDTLNNTGATIEVTLTALVPFTATHGEMIISYADALYAQFPEISRGYEEEFNDWQAAVQLELPLVAAVSEGDYLTDGRYRKVWKISNITTRSTSNETMFAQTADVRVLHTFENLAQQLELFTGIKGRPAFR